MEFFKIRHIPTGLYYQTGNINLTVEGQRFHYYTLVDWGSCLECKVPTKSPEYRKLSKVKGIIWEYHGDYMKAFIPTEQIEKVVI